MKEISLVVVIVALVQWSSGLNVLDGATANIQVVTSPVYSFSSSAGSSSSSSSSPSTIFSYSFGSGTCCTLDSWAHNHMNLITEFASRLRQAYNIVSNGPTGGYSYTSWPESITSLTGKSSIELDAICHHQAEQLVKDVLNGLVTANDINKDNFFEWKASNILQTNYAPLNFNVNGIISSIQFPADISAERIDNFQNKISRLFSTATVNRQYNKTSVTDGSGVVVSGSQSQKKWVNGVLVSDIERPFVYTNDWKQIEHNNLKKFLQENNLNLDAFINRYFKDYQQWQQWNSQYNVQSKEIAEWLRNEVKDLKSEGFFREVSADVTKSLENLIRQRVKADAWQTELRSNLIKLIKENDFTVEQYHKWLLLDHTRLMAFASRYDIDIDEIINWLDHEQPQFVTIGLFKPKQTLSNWQSYVRSQLEDITRQQYKSIQELQKAVIDLKLFEKCSTDYQIQVELVETWINKELARLLEEGELKINNITAWQMVLMQRVYNLLKQNRPLTLNKVKEELNKDGDLAFRHHSTAEDIRKWVENLVQRLKVQQPNKNWQDELRRICEKEYIINLNIIESQKQNMVTEFNVYAQETNTKLQAKNQVLDTNFNLYVKDFNSLNEDELDIALTLKEFQIQKDSLLSRLLKNSKLNIEHVHDLLLEDDKTLVNLTRMYSVYTNKVEELFKNENIDADYQKLLKELNTEKAHSSVINDPKSLAAVEDLEFQVKIYHRQLTQLQSDFKVKLYEIQNWLEYIKNEELDNLNELLMSTINQYNNLVADNYFEVEKLSRKLIDVNNRLSEFAKLYNVKLSLITSNANKELEESHIHISNINTNLEKLSWELEKELLDISKSVKYLSTKELESKIRYAKEILAAYQSNIEKKEIVVSNVKKLQEQYSYKFSELKGFESNWKAEHKQILEETTTKVDDYSKNVKNKSVEFAQTLEKCHKTFSLKYQRENEISQQYNTHENDLNKWLRSELDRLNEIIKFLNSERTRVEEICNKNYNVSVEAQIVKDRSHLQSMATKYHISNKELELWERQLLKRLLEAQYKTQNEVWQQKLRKLVSNILLENEATLQDFKLILDLTQDNQNFGASSEIHEFIKQEVARLQSKGMVKNEELNEWQISTRDKIVAFLRSNWSVDEVERKLLSQTEHNENEAWIKKTCKLLQALSKLNWESKQFSVNFVPAQLEYGHVQYQPQVEHHFEQQQQQEKVEYGQQQAQLENSFVQQLVQGQHQGQPEISFIHQILNNKDGNGLLLEGHVQVGNQQGHHQKVVQTEQKQVIQSGPKKAGLIESLVKLPFL